jgi:hypothetical protein
MVIVTFLLSAILAFIYYCASEGFWRCILIWWLHDGKGWLSLVRSG